MKSKSGSMNSEEWKAWGKNFLKFWVAPVGLVYLTSVLGVLQQDNHTFSLKDFIPSQLVIGGMLTTTFNSGIDLLRKIQQG